MRRAALAWVCLLVMAGVAFAESSFSVKATLQPNDRDSRLLHVSFGIPARHYLYADQISITAAEDMVLTPRNIPVAVQKFDAFLEKDVPVYERDMTFVYVITGVNPGDALDITVAYQGCNDQVCFLPQRSTFSLAWSTLEPAQATALVDAEIMLAGADDWIGLAQKFKMSGRAAGYVKAPEFIAFLDEAESGRGINQDALITTLNRRGMLAVAIMILLGGLALNLTPCVLPMIPINIAIIGAGAQGGTRTRGLALGATYGAGIAAAYGLLGLAVVLTGSKFGTLNSSPVFNLIIAALFLLMTLAMFDIITVDLSRFQGHVGASGKRKGGFLTALTLGAIAALLAGACVAPVVISVLLLSADFYARGNLGGLFLPFLLGAGMALPWPFAGAGLSFLPKPGKWMNTVKHVFGIIILLFALWYGRLGISLMQAPACSTSEKSESTWITSLQDGLAMASAEGKPVFIDFWATWCKNCLKMEKTTFKDESVQQRLQPYVKIKYQAENPADGETKAVLDRFGVLGLPTYVVLQPEN